MKLQTLPWSGNRQLTFLISPHVSRWYYCSCRCCTNVATDSSLATVRSKKHESRFDLQIPTSVLRNCCIDTYAGFVTRWSGWKNDGGDTKHKSVGEHSLTQHRSSSSSECSSVNSCFTSVSITLLLHLLHSSLSGFFFICSWEFPQLFQLFQRCLWKVTRKMVPQAVLLCSSRRASFVL